MTFWRRRKPKWPPGGFRSDPLGAQRFREVPEADAPPDEEWADPDPEAGTYEPWESDEFTQAEGSDAGEYDLEPEEEDRPGVVRGVFFGRPARGVPDTDASQPHVVSTILSKKPGKDAARAVAWTLGILAVVSTLYWWGPPGFAAALPASGETVFEQGETWRLLTAIAAHADAIHLLSNAVFLAWLIYLSYGAFGSSLYPWSAVPLSAVALAVTLEGYPPNIRVVGASGMLYLLAGAWLTLYVLVERRLSVAKRIVRVVGFFLVVLVPTSIRPEVSYRA
ncbi:MAG: rhomboid family intramembrane serine protease, partial [Acidobacteria bacterium]|nr:rhomboid family intramembrane serine protease [Acidobacteriota bacterium]